MIEVHPRFEAAMVNGSGIIVIALIAAQSVRWYQRA